MATTIDVYYQYISKYPDQDPEPALVISRRRFHRGSSWALCLSSAHEVLDMPGEQKDKGIMLKAMTCAKILGLETKSEIYDIADIILASLGALVKMKPWELVKAEVTKRQETSEEAVLTIDGKSFDIDTAKHVHDEVLTRQ